MCSAEKSNVTRLDWTGLDCSLPVNSSGDSHAHQEDGWMRIYITRALHPFSCRLAPTAMCVRRPEAHSAPKRQNLRAQATVVRWQALAEGEGVSESAI